MNTVDEYLASLSPERHEQYERIRTLVREMAPDAELSMSYGMPTFKIGKKPLLYFGSFKDHLSLFPASGHILAEMGDELAPFKQAKGTLQFTPDKPIPDDAIREMLRLRLAEL